MIGVLSIHAIILVRKRESSLLNFKYLLVAVWSLIMFYASLPYGALGWSAEYDCGIHFPHTLFITKVCFSHLQLENIFFHFSLQVKIVVFF